MNTPPIDEYVDLEAFKEAALKNNKSVIMKSIRKSCPLPVVKELIMFCLSNNNLEPLKVALEREAFLSGRKGDSYHLYFAASLGLESELAPEWHNYIMEQRFLLKASKLHKLIGDKHWPYIFVNYHEKLNLDELFEYMGKQDSFHCRDYDFSRLKIIQDLFGLRVINEEEFIIKLLKKVMNSEIDFFNDSKNTRRKRWDYILPKHEKKINNNKKVLELIFYEEEWVIPEILKKMGCFEPEAISFIAKLTLKKRSVSNPEPTIQILNYLSSLVKDGIPLLDEISEIIKSEKNREDTEHHLKRALEFIDFSEIEANRSTSKNVKDNLLSVARKLNSIDRNKMLILIDYSYSSGIFSEDEKDSLIEMMTQDISVGDFLVLFCGINERIKFTEKHKGASYVYSSDFPTSYPAIYFIKVIEDIIYREVSPFKIGPFQEMLKIKAKLNKKERERLAYALYINRQDKYAIYSSMSEVDRIEKPATLFDLLLKVPVVSSHIFEELKEIDKLVDRKLKRKKKKESKNSHCE